MYETQKMIELTTNIRIALNAVLADKSGAQLICQPRGIYHKFTVYIGNSVVCTITVSSTGQMVWRSKHRLLNATLKELYTEHIKAPGVVNRVSSRRTGKSVQLA